MEACDSGNGKNAKGGDQGSEVKLVEKDGLPSDCSMQLKQDVSARRRLAEFVSQVVGSLVMKIGWRVSERKILAAGRSRANLRPAFR